MKKNSVSINPVDLLTEDSLLYFKTVFSYRMVNKEFKSKRCSASCCLYCPTKLPQFAKVFDI